MRRYVMKIVYQNENDFLKPSFSSFSHKLLEDSKYYYHILDKEDEHFNYLKETEPEKLSILNQIKDLQNLLTTNELIFDTKPTHDYLGYSENKYPRISISSQLRDIDSQDKLTVISIFFEELNELIKKGHKYHIVFPNLFSEHSIFYDIKKETLRLSGVDTLQIEDYQSIHINPFLNDSRILDRIYGSLKYYDDQHNLYRPNFDQFNLMNQFFIYTLGVNLSYQIVEQEEQGIDYINTISKFLKQYGLESEKELFLYLKQLYFFDENKFDIRDAYPYIQALEDDYQLDQNSRFVKRKKLIM